MEVSQVEVRLTVMNFWVALRQRPLMWLLHVLFQSITDASVIFYPSPTYSYVPSYFVSYLDFPRSTIEIHVHVSTPVGDSIFVDHLYRSCFVTIGGFEIIVDLLLLSMADFDVILHGVDWLSPYHTILNCHAKTVMLAIPGLPRLEWKGSLRYTSSRVVSFLKA
ncbi:uncharacterized protein [Nicotiana tomentosiformis]|uniref:uncharacterized protein n=1 Tax=Nicotiana tomentosiformis TaxID=4098 RepID=UPI00388C3C2D